MIGRIIRPTTPRCRPASADMYVCMYIYIYIYTYIYIYIHIERGREREREREIIHIVYYNMI